MRDLIGAVRAGWNAYLDLRATRIASRRWKAQQRRIRAMTDDELITCAAQWGGSVCFPEMQRRGLPVPQGVTHA